MALLPNIHKSAPREYKDGKVIEREGSGSAMGSAQGSVKGSFIGSFKDGTVKNSSGSVRSSASQRPERQQAMDRSQSEPNFKRRPPHRPKRDPSNKFKDWVEEDIRFPFKRP